MITVLLAEGHTMVREGLRALVNLEQDMRVVGEAADGNAAVSCAKEHQPDVVVVDVHLPGLDGFATTRQITDHQSVDVKVIALALMASPGLVTEMLDAGASGYLLKDSSFEALALGIRSVNQGQYYLGPGLDQQLVDAYLERVAQRNPVRSTLATREREVLRLLAEGNATKEIAAHLGLSVKTIETYRRRIMQKTKIFTIAGLTKYAIAQGLTSPFP